jgi:hypothetical protein
MVLNLSPLAAHLQESLTSLRFATKVCHRIFTPIIWPLIAHNTTIGTAKKQTHDAVNRYDYYLLIKSTEDSFAFTLLFSSPFLLQHARCDTSGVLLLCTQIKDFFQTQSDPNVTVSQYTL